VACDSDAEPLDNLNAEASNAATVARLFKGDEPPARMRLEKLTNVESFPRKVYGISNARQVDRAGLRLGNNSTWTAR
jgi:hypothetical protein